MLSQTTTWELQKKRNIQNRAILASHRFQKIVLKGSARKIILASLMKPKGSFGKKTYYQLCISGSFKRSFFFSYANQYQYCSILLYIVRSLFPLLQLSIMQNLSNFFGLFYRNLVLRAFWNYNKNLQKLCRFCFDTVSFFSLILSLAALVN